MKTAFITKILYLNKKVDFTESNPRISSIFFSSHFLLLSLYLCCFSPDDFKELDCLRQTICLIIQYYYSSMITFLHTFYTCI